MLKRLLQVIGLILLGYVYILVCSLIATILLPDFNVIGSTTFIAIIMIMFILFLWEVVLYIINGEDS